jgi:hypothetical protein
MPASIRGTIAEPYLGRDLLDRLPYDLQVADDGIDGLGVHDERFPMCVRRRTSRSVLSAVTMSSG